MLIKRIHHCLYQTYRHQGWRTATKENTTHLTPPNSHRKIFYFFNIRRLPTHRIDAPYNMAIKITIWTLRFTKWPVNIDGYHFAPPLRGNGNLQALACRVPVGDNLVNPHGIATLFDSHARGELSIKNIILPVA